MEPARPPASPPPPVIPCPDCRGAGKITLFTSVQTCDRCAGTGKLDPMLDRSVDEIELSVRSRNLLKRLGIKTIRELVKQTPIGLVKAHKSSPLAVSEIILALSRLGLHLKDA